MMISLSFKMDFDDFLDFFRRISLWGQAPSCKKVKGLADRDDGR